MGNKLDAEARETMEVKRTRISGNFKRIKTTIEGYDPMRGSREWEKVQLEVYQGEMLSHKNNSLEDRVVINKDFLLIADDPFYFELLIRVRTSVWRLRAETLNDFLDWKHTFIISRRPDASNSNRCEIDNKKFSYFSKKIQCKNCGVIVCKKCSCQKALLHSLGYYSVQPICNVCRNELRSAQQSQISSIIDKHRFISKSLMRRSGIDSVLAKGNKDRNYRQRSLPISILGSGSFIN